MSKHLVTVRRKNSLLTGNKPPAESGSGRGKHPAGTVEDESRRRWDKRQTMGEEPEFNNFLNKCSSGIKYTESKKRCVKDKHSTLDGHSSSSLLKHY